MAFLKGIMGSKKLGKEWPTCIEEGCECKVELRQNWHTMSDEYAMEADEFHHRCGPCYVAWLCRNKGANPTRAAKEYECDGCRRMIEKGTTYYLTFRPAYFGAKYPERVHVCKNCYK